MVIIEKRQASSGFWYVTFVTTWEETLEVKFLTEPTELEITTKLTEIEQIRFQEKKIEELRFIESSLLQGSDVFPPDKGNFKYNSRQEAIVFLVEKYKVSTELDKILKIYYLLSNVTDEEFLSFGYTSEEITAIRAKQTELNSIAAILASYSPLAT